VSEAQDLQHDEVPDFIAADTDYAGGCIGGVCEF